MAVGKGSIKRIENASVTKESPEVLVEKAVTAVPKKTRKPRAKKPAVNTNIETPEDKTENNIVATGVVEDIHGEKFRLISNIKSDLPDHLL